MNKELNKFHIIKQDKIRSIIRGHLLSIDKVPIALKQLGHELFKTEHHTIIVTEDGVSFKQQGVVIGFKFHLIKQFYLQNCQTFVIIREGENKRHYFTIK